MNNLLWRSTIRTASTHIMYRLDGWSLHVCTSKHFIGWKLLPLISLCHKEIISARSFHPIKFVHASTAGIKKCMIVFIPFFHRDYIHSMIHWEEFKEKSRTCLVSYIKELELHSFGTLRALFPICIRHDTIHHYITVIWDISYD
jgi:hypothetical protein